MKKTESAPRRLTPLDPKEEKRAQELEQVLIAAGYSYAEATQTYAESLKATGTDRSDRVGVAMDRLMAAGAALSEAALALQDVPVVCRP